MEVYEAVRTALAVRQYQDKPVPAETVRLFIRRNIALFYRG